MSHDDTFVEPPLKFAVVPMSRREVFVKGIAGALAIAGFGSRAGVVLAGTPGVAHGETPGVTEGPYWVDGQLNRSNVLVDTSTNTTYSGLPLYLGLTVSQLSDTKPYTIKPLAGARVDIWQCNAQGVYSDIASENTTGQNYLRGYQATNAHGVVQFLTLYPGWYVSRTPHIHLRIRTYNSAGTVTYDFTTQLFFNDAITNMVYSSVAAYDRSTTRDTTNATDSVFTGSSFNGSPATEAGDYLMAKLADDTSHAQAAFHMIVDLSDSANTGGTGNGNAAVKTNAVTAPTANSTSRAATRRRAR